MYRIKLNNECELPEIAVATIGNFDGLHLGHQQLINQVDLIGKRYNYRRCLITFEPLPLEFFSDKKGVVRQARLNLLRDKYLFLKNSGLIDELIILHFNKQLANLSADEFIQQTLLNKLNIHHMVVGNDFHFGKSAMGDIKLLRQYNLTVTIVPDYIINGCRVSSSLIREFAHNNELEQMQIYLGKPITYTSKVIHGNALGRKYGVPTINLALAKNRPALWGIYIALVYIDGIRYNAVASIGKNPTVSNQEVYKLEAHLLNIDLDLYGKIATVELVKFLRFELKFDNLESLFKQIHADIAQANNYFIKSSN